MNLGMTVNAFVICESVVTLVTGLELCNVSLTDCNLNIAFVCSGQESN